MLVEAELRDGRGCVRSGRAARRARASTRAAARALSASAESHAACGPRCGSGAGPPARPPNPQRRLDRRARRNRIDASRRARARLRPGRAARLRTISQGFRGLHVAEDAHGLETHLGVRVAQRPGSACWAEFLGTVAERLDHRQPHLRIGVVHRLEQHAQGFGPSSPVSISTAPMRSSGSGSLSSGACSSSISCRVLVDRRRRILRESPASCAPPPSALRVAGPARLAGRRLRGARSRRAARRAGRRPRARCVPVDDACGCPIDGLGNPREDACGCAGACAPRPDSRSWCRRCADTATAATSTTTHRGGNHRQAAHRSLLLHAIAVRTAVSLADGSPGRLRAAPLPAVARRPPLADPSPSMLCLLHSRTPFRCRWSRPMCEPRVSPLEVTCDLSTAWAASGRPAAIFLHFYRCLTARETRPKVARQPAALARPAAPTQSAAARIRPVAARPPWRR